MTLRKNTNNRIENAGHVVTSIIKRRRELGIGQTELSHSLGLDKATWGHIERGARHLRAEEMLRACEILGLEVILRYK